MRFDEELVGEPHEKLTLDEEGAKLVIAGARSELVGPAVVTVQCITGRRWPIMVSTLMRYLVPEERPAKV